MVVAEAKVEENTEEEADKTKEAEVVIEVDPIMSEADADIGMMISQEVFATNLEIKDFANLETNVVSNMSKAAVIDENLLATEEEEEMEEEEEAKEEITSKEVNQLVLKLLLAK